jgi:penicillin amidase
MMANDPHRRHQNPSLRYWIHLNAPGWNVIGGGEPCLPGVSIGHNDYGAWGLTIFSIDQEDLYVYETNPSNPDQYKYKGNWENMKVLKETIPVRGKKPHTVNLKYTRHGPVLYEDKENAKAYALRAAWLEIGGAPYLASLRMDQAKTWEEFRDACRFSMTPSENMVWADKENNIGWQAVGITPLRNNWFGLLPVPGDGRYEWEGYLPIKKLPHVFNPPDRYFATANQDNIPRDYPYRIGYLWTDPFRFHRIQEVLSSGRRFTMTDMIQLQLDEYSIPARNLVPLLNGLESSDPKAEKARKKLLSWDYVMDIESVEATLYLTWERFLSRKVWGLLLPKEKTARSLRGSLKRIIDHLLTPDGHFGTDPVAGREAVLIQSLKEAVKSLDKRLGQDMDKWQYGQEKFHHCAIPHLLSEAVSEDLRKKLDIGPMPRGGNVYTVNMTTNSYNQTAGGSFRIIADTANWDNSVGTNCPGQSGDPKSPHYADLFKPWAEGKYFPIFFSREKIESAAGSHTTLNPIKK